MKDLEIVLCQMPFLMLSGLKPAASGLQNQGPDHEVLQPSVPQNTARVFPNQSNWNNKASTLL